MSKDVPQPALSGVVHEEVSVYLCEVCKKNEIQGVYSSSCGPISFAYCGDCASKGAEPYGALVAYISSVYDVEEWNLSEFQEHWRNTQLVRVSLEAARRTFDEWVADVRNSIIELNEKIAETERKFLENPGVDHNGR